MPDELQSYLENAQRKLAEAEKEAKGERTAIIHPMVFPNQEEAKKAAEDWEYRKMAAVQKKIEEAVSGR